MPITTEDFHIDETNRRISHVLGATTIYSVNALYSYIQDYFDEVGSMSISVPMSAQTPTEYRLEDSWFMDNNCIPFLRSGAIKTLGQDAAIYQSGIYIVKFDSVGYTNSIDSDIGKPVVAGATTGVLLSYDNTLRKWWIRRDVGTTWNGAVTITGGVGVGTIVSAVTGESLIANIFTLGALEPSVTSNLYVEQINPELVDNKVAQFWLTGHIDILIQVKEANVLIDSGLVRVYDREEFTLYSHFLADVSAGGRNPIPLSTLLDSNDVTPTVTVDTWTDVTVTFGSIQRNIGDGVFRTYDVEIDCGTRTNLQEVYERLKRITGRQSLQTLNGKPGYFYRSTNESYLENVSAPFGAYSGGKFFGARGVWLKNVPALDINSYQVVSSDSVTSVAPYASAGVLHFDPELATGGTGHYRMYFTTNPLGDYGTETAVTVNDSFGNPITGLVTSQSIGFTFDYTNNQQGGRTSGTDAAVTVVAFNAGLARPIVVTGLINASKAVSIVLDTIADPAYT